MLAACPQLLNARWLHDETVLHFVAIGECTDAVRFLALRGADVNAGNEFGDSALIDVAGLGFVEIVDVLLNHGADANATSPITGNPLHAAAFFGHPAVMGRLLKGGADGTYRTRRGESIFDAVNDASASRREESSPSLRSMASRKLLRRRRIRAPTEVR
jgi:ankyrin repeat protein